MKIKSLTATFGKLEKARLELGEGLNLIEAPNEGGKSTWCAFWRAMLYGIDTRDRDKKGYLADKNRYQPWSGLPMEGEAEVEWQGRFITLRRGPRGNAPFAAFSAVYTGTEEPVPGLTAQTCGELLTGAGREVFERSAFIGSGGSLTVTAAPELERRIAALVSSGEEDVSYSQTERRLREWLNRRRVNRSVGLIPRLEGDLARAEEELARAEDIAGQATALEGERSALKAELEELDRELAIHQRLDQRERDLRCAQAAGELEQARAQLARLEEEAGQYGPLPGREELKQAQGELQYLKVLEEEVRRGEEALHQADEAYVQAQIAVQDGHFQGLSPEEAARQVQRDKTAWQTREGRAGFLGRLAGAVPAAGALAALMAGIFFFTQKGTLFSPGFYPFLALLALTLAAGLWAGRLARRLRREEAAILARYGVDNPAALGGLLQDYQARYQAAQEAADRAKMVRGGLNEQKARLENSRSDLLRFVHTFAPQASGLYGCSAALSRALGLDHELALARERVEERRRRREDLLAQGGREEIAPQEALARPARTPEQLLQAREGAARRLDGVQEQLNQLLGRQKALGDPAALAARREELAGELARREEEYGALTLALKTLEGANARLQERFSPELNRLAGEYLSRLTGGRYASLTLSRELEGMAARAGDVLPRSALYLSRGTADQLYLAVRLAVCRLCLPEKPPLVLDDALAAFDDGRLALALGLLEELAGEQQVLLFTCQGREGALLAGRPGVTRLVLPE